MHLSPRWHLLLIIILAGLSVCAAASAETGLSDLLNRFKAEPDNALLCEQIGIAYTKTGNLTQAAFFFQKAIRIDPQHIPARKNLATVLWFLGRKNESETLFRDLEKRIPDDPVPQLYLGLSAYERRDYETAATHFDRARELASDNPETLPIVVETYLLTSRYAAARNTLERGLEQKPDSAKLLFELGLAYALDGNFESGRQAFLRANASDRHSPLPLMALGIVDLQTGNATSAAAYFGKAQNLAPQDYRPYYFRAIALKHSQANGDVATRVQQLRDLHRAVELDPSQESAWAALGEIEISAGHNAQGQADLRHALLLAPHDPGVLYKLALLYRREGKSQESERLLHSFRETKGKAQADENELISLLQTPK